MNELKSMLLERRISPAPASLKKVPWRKRAIYLFPLPWLLLFIYAGPGLRWFDPGAAAIDIGVLSALVFALLSVGLFALACKLLLPYPVFTLQQLSVWQRSLLYAGSYLGLLYAFVAALIALLS